MAYTNEVLNEIFNPENVGVIKGADGVGKVVDSETGEIMKIYILLDNDIVVQATYQTFGCVGAIASASMATKMLIGKNVDEVEKIVNDMNALLPSAQKEANKKSAK